GMAVEVDGEPVPPPNGGRARALLAWLALHPGMHSRAELAARFWPDVLDSSARASLRSAMWSLRRARGDGGERHRVATRDRVGRGPRGVRAPARTPPHGAGARTVRGDTRAGGARARRRLGARPRRAARRAARARPEGVLLRAGGP